MRSFETGVQRSPDSEPSGKLIASPEVQLELMLLAYRANHEREADLPAITPTLLERNSDEIFASARDEWVDETHDLSLAERVRLYADEFPDERVDTKDEAALGELLTRVKGWKSKTLH